LRLERVRHRIVERGIGLEAFGETHDGATRTEIQPEQKPHKEQQKQSVSQLHKVKY
jgi:hypothetical protein